MKIEMEPRDAGLKPVAIDWEERAREVERVRLSIEQQAGIQRTRRQGR